MTRALLRPLLTATGLVVLMVAMLGLAYPFAMTGIAHWLSPYRADGSLVRVSGRIVGSELAGQAFTSPAYFHPRPSATTPPYNSSATTFSNLGPNTTGLKKAVDGSIADALRLEAPYNPGLRARDLPVDMITPSGSGIDPEITVANARLQSARVAAVRGLDLALVRRLVDANTRGRWIGLFGEPGVNVLMLNIALDRAAGPPAR